jgi:hypothetical protein
MFRRLRVRLSVLIGLVVPELPGPDQGLVVGLQ